MSFRNGVLVGLGIGLLLLGTVFIGFAYQVYSIRINYCSEVVSAYNKLGTMESLALTVGVIAVVVGLILIIIGIILEKKILKK
ncbi:MAG: hypothetical protein J7L82_02325 [Staphylothermus sp.]|nr:hypothetical protein [Staphylothermus sp.]